MKPQNSSTFPKRRVSLAAAIALTVATLAPLAQAAPALKLETMAHSKTAIWNAVVTDNDRIFVSGPHWTGSQGPALSIIEKNGKPQPYPDSSWNAWKPGADPSHSFVDVNALHRDDHGGLWVIDTGSPQFGGNPLPGGAKAVRIDLATNKVDRVYAFPADAALPGSYVDDIRFHGDQAYFTDAGKAGLIVMNLTTGQTHRVLEGDPSVTAPAGRKVIVDGHELIGPDGKVVTVQVDPMETSPDGKYLYFGPLSGPWSKIETQYLDDATLSAAEVAKHVEPWTDLPPVGGTTMDTKGNLFFTELSTDSLKVRTPEGKVSTLIQDKRLHWIDAPYLDDKGYIWLPTPQMDRVALFHNGKSQVKQPMSLYRVKLPAL